MQKLRCFWYRVPRSMQHSARILGSRECMMHCLKSARASFRRPMPARACPRRFHESANRGSISMATVKSSIAPVWQELEVSAHA